MKKIKLYWNGKRLRDIYPYATWFEVLKWKMYRFLRKGMIMAFVAGLLFGAFKLGTTTNEITYAAPEKVLVEVPVKAAVMDRIAMCESHNMHMKNGQVILNANKNGSVDMGVFQINVSIWGKKAAELGFNLAVEKDNRAFVQYLYENFGTEPWVWSKGCWNK